MTALIGLSLLLFLGGSAARPFSIPSLQPALLIPALILVAAALVAAFRFPLENRYTLKLQRFLMLKENGETNIPLQKQLEDVLVRVKRRRYGIKLLIRFLRLLFPTKVEGQENVKLDPDIPCVFTCNHGELYGPIIANLYIPFPFPLLDDIRDGRLTADRHLPLHLDRQAPALAAGKIEMARRPLLLRTRDDLDRQQP